MQTRKAARSPAAQRLHPGWLQVGYVKGIDLSPGEIVEARKRFKEQAAKRRGQYRTFEHGCTDTSKSCLPSARKSWLALSVGCSAHAVSPLCLLGQGRRCIFSAQDCRQGGHNTLSLFLHRMRCVSSTGGQARWAQHTWPLLASSGRQTARCLQEQPRVGVSCMRVAEDASWLAACILCKHSCTGCLSCSTVMSMAADSRSQAPRGCTGGGGVTTTGVLCADCRGCTAGLGAGGVPACSHLLHSTSCQLCSLHGMAPLSSCCSSLWVLPNELYHLQVASWFSPLQDSLLLLATYHVHNAQA